MSNPKNEETRSLDNSFRVTNRINVYTVQKRDIDRKSQKIRPLQEVIKPQEKEKMKAPIGG